jgi:O-succinylbenzoic acid--CoA ligase
LAAALDWLPATWESWWCDRARQGTRRTNGKHSPSRPFPATSCFFSEQLFPSTAAARARQSSVFHKNPPAIDLAVVVAHKDPADYLGALLSALASGYSAYCANPHWGATEWAESGLPFTQSSTFFSPGEQGSKTDVPPQPHIHIPTGGTGGRVRFVTHTTETLFAAAHAQLEALGGTLCLNAVSPLPPWHISGLMPAVRALASGGRLVLADGAFAPEMPLPLLPPTPPGNAWYVSLVPTQLQRLLDRHGEDGAAWLRQFHCVLLGGAPAAPALLERARRAKLRIGIGYGMTETAAFVALHTPEDFLVARPVSGKILPHTRIRILDANGNLQATDTAGRVSICATSLAHGMPCLLTQDEGVLDAAGHLSILGRLDRFILTGGEKVDPRRVEAALLAAPWVCAALVVGEPDEEWGGRVVALVELADGAPQNWSAALAELTRTALARHCVPKRWVAVPHLPFNEKGKLDHAALSAILRA